MMGHRQVEQAALFYEFSLERHIPADHLLRSTLGGENFHLSRMIERTAKTFDLHPSRLLGDSAYGSADMLVWLVDAQGIEPHVTVFDKSARQDGTFAREDFTYDAADDIYLCPGGKTLTQQAHA